MLEACLVFLAASALGVAQSAPSVTTGDAGELAAAAAVWGIPHAPGYPGYVLLARAAGILLPVGDWAHRAALCSALCGAAAMALLVDALRREGLPLHARLGAAAVLGLSPSWRELSAVSEVFMPLMLCAALLYWITVAAGDRLLDPGPAAAMGVVLGFGLGVHQTLVLVVPALLISGHGRRGLWPRALSYAVLGTVIGFSVHFAVPLRALKSPPVDWSHAVDLPSFLHLLLRKDYGTGSLTVDGQSSVGVVAQLWRSLPFVLRSFGYVGCCALLIGLSTSKPPSPILWFVMTGPLFLLLGKPGADPQTSYALERFYLLPLFGLAPVLARGFSVRFGPVLAAAAVALSLPPALAASRRSDYLAHDYGRALQRSLPHGALFLMDGGDDTFYSLMFLQHASGLRRDVELRDRGGVVFPGLYGADFRSLPREAKDLRRREVETAAAASGRLWCSAVGDSLGIPGSPLVPASLVRRPAKDAAAFREARALDATLVVRLGAESGYRDRALAAFIPYSRGVSALARGDAVAGAAWLESAHASAPEALWTEGAVAYALGAEGYRAVGRKDYAAAEALYRAAVAVTPGKAEPRVNLGVTLERAGRTKEAEEAFRAASRAEPRSPLPWKALGARLWADARWADAASAFSSAAAADPSDAASAGYAAEADRRARRAR